MMASKLVQKKGAPLVRPSGEREIKKNKKYYDTESDQEETDAESIVQHVEMPIFSNYIAGDSDESDSGSRGFETMRKETERVGATSKATKETERVGASAKLPRRKERGQRTQIC